jgi:cytochrome c oxidase assembly factor CtaG
VINAWDWEPSIVIGCAALAIGFLVMTHGRQRNVWYFFAGVLVLLLDLVSPLDMLADQYLFSAHIVQHLVLAMVVPPLLIAGMSSLRLPAVSAPASWSVGIGAMVFWHIPVVFNAALANDGLHIAQHLSFLISGTIFWWTLRRLPPLTAISYLFGACLACSVLGAALTFARPGVYPAYLYPEDRLGFLSLIREGWGLDPKTDQQLGGLLMWVPGCFIYLSAILMTLARWYGKKEETA